MRDEDHELARKAGEALSRAGLTLAVAESCTGGLLGGWLTAVPGSSDYFLGGVISYSDSVKEMTLGVERAVIERYGAVSAECAQQMALGALRQTGAGLAVAITGVAGPAGGTEQKPVGLTYIALASGNWSTVERHLWHGDRQANREESVRRALVAITEFANGRYGADDRPGT